MARRGALAGLFLTLWAGAAALAQPPPSIGVSGHETFPGLPVADLTVATTFAGWTAVDGAAWYPIAQHTNGSWFAAISYRGDARAAGGQVTLLNGYWAVTFADATYGGEIVDGRVHWPDGTEPDWPCHAIDGGYPVARFAATLRSAGGTASGSFIGCLDDIRWDRAQPLVAIPPIWGELRLSPP
jgi:hypothetical protein